MAKFKGVGFDLDGTLIESMELTLESSNYALQAVGYTIDNFVDELRSRFGPPEDVFFYNILQDTEKAKRATEIYVDHFWKNRSQVYIYPQVDALFELVKKKKMKIGIITGRMRSLTEDLLEYLGFKQNYDILISGSDLTNHKPHPEGLEVFLKHCNLTADEILFIGDTHYDIGMANRAHVKVGHARWAKVNWELNDSLKVDYTFNSIEEVFDILK